MRRVAQDDSFSLMPSKNCQRMTEHLQFPTPVPDLIGDLIGDPGFCPHVSSQMEGRKRKILDPRSGRG